MLTQLHIHHLVTIEKLALDLSSGTTVITGETGAGKSILIDAIELALGGRTRGNIVRAGQEKADISLCFDISKNIAARAWLKEYDLQADSYECIIRRTVGDDGRSKSYINGFPTTLQPLRELSELLIDIHGQHEHQTLLKSDVQRNILDRYAGHFDLVDKVHALSQEWHATNKEIKVLYELTSQRKAKTELLKFQLEEFEKLRLQPNEFEQLDIEHKQLAHAEELIKNLNFVTDNFSENNEINVRQLLTRSLQALENIQRVDPKISTWIDSIKNALIFINDTEDDIQRYLHSVEIDPHRLNEVEERISTLFDLSRKHKIEPAALYDFQQELLSEYQSLENSDEKLLSLQCQLKDIEKQYQTLAETLSEQRKKAAKKLEKEIITIIQTLSLPHAIFRVSLEKNNDSNPLPYGLEKIIFEIQTNPGQPMQALHKVVSGGELSRIGLAIHMATTSQHAISTLIFDEVDVGIGGSTAEIVGKLLRSLGKTHQIICITHQPQVAALGHHHLLVEKRQQHASTFTQVRMLTEKEKVAELGRMLGGVEVTDKTLAHAKEMLEKSAVTT